MSIREKQERLKSAIQSWEQAAEEYRKGFQERDPGLFGEGGLLKTIGKRAIEAAQEGEMTHHLGYPPHDPNGHF